MPIDLNAAKARLKAHMGREWVTQHPPLAPLLDSRAGAHQARRQAEPLEGGERGHLPPTEGPLPLPEETPEDLSHLTRSCPAKDVARRHIFGRYDPTLAETFRDVNVPEETEAPLT